MPGNPGENESRVWLRNTRASLRDLTYDVTAVEVRDAGARLARFAPLLAALFPDEGWDGKVHSDLLPYPMDQAITCLIKGDHALPMTGSIKARGGVHELLCFIEDIALRYRVMDDDVLALAGQPARTLFAEHRVLVASTGNLGYSIGLIARALGLQAEVHMSRDAKPWKKDRLRGIGATVVEHPCDYTETVARAREAARGKPMTLFVDDENSRRLMTGYAAAASEVAVQIGERGIAIGPGRPLIAYLPCGVGGAPGGIALGLKQIYGDHVICVTVEPTASPAMLVALASGDPVPPSVTDYGCDNATIADGLAVGRVSQLALTAVGPALDAAIAVTDEAMIASVREAWQKARLRLEPSAAAALAAVPVLQAAMAKTPGWPSFADSVHLCWATGGARLPDSEFLPMLEEIV